MHLGGILKWLMTLLGIFKSASRNIIKEHPGQINFEELVPWLDKYSSKLVEKENLHDYLTRYVNFLKDKRWLLRQQVEEDKNVPADLNHECKEFLQLLAFKDDLGLKETLALNSKLEEKLDKILPSPEIEIVNQLLKLFSEISNARKKFTDKINQSGYPRIANLHKKLSSLQIYRSRVVKYEDELRNKKRRLYLTEDKLKEKEKHLDSLQDEPESLLVLQARKKRDVMVKESEEIEDSVEHFFSEIKPLLQKYSSLIDANGLLASYIDDPLNTFLDDEGLAIKHSLQHLRAVLNSGKFSWSVEENLFLLEKLDLMPEDQLEQMQMKLLNLKRQLETLEEPSIDEDKKVDIDDTEYRLQHFTGQIGKLEEEISSLEEKIDNLKEDFLKEVQLFQNLVNIGFGIELNVKI